MKFKNKIKIKVNGKKIISQKNETIEKLVKRLNLPINKVAIELNRKILDKHRLNKKIFNKNKINRIKLNNNYSIEIVHFIGGG